MTLQIANLLTAVEGSVRVACVAQDAALATEVARGLLAQRGVAGVKIVSGERVLADLRKVPQEAAPVPEGELLLRQVSARFENNAAVGEIAVRLDSKALGEESFGYSASLVLCLFGEVLAAAMAVAWLVLKTIVQPIKLLADDLHARQRQQTDPVVLPRRHEANEIGQLAKVFNRLMDGMSEMLRKELHLRTEIASNEHRFQMLVEQSSDTICRFDRHCRRIYANARLVGILGGKAALILGARPSEFPGGMPALKYETEIRKVFEQGRELNFEHQFQAADGERHHHIRLTPEMDAHGQVVQVLAVGRDITEIERYRHQVSHQALHDALTDLPNRTLLQDRMQQILAGASYRQHQLCVMLLDLDRFKEINDTLGHAVGDRLLRETAKRLLACVRAHDTVARLGGDEFAILLDDAYDEKHLARIAEKLLQALIAPFEVEGREYFISGSIGIARCSSASETVDDLLKYADAAMYHAKRQGRNNFQFYATELTTRSSERLELESALRRAMDRGELELHYQPKLDLRSGRMIGAEALLRWRRQGHGMVMPDRFIPIAEDSGLIVDIGAWVLHAACEAVVAWNLGILRTVSVAVNISTRQFLRHDLVGLVRRTLDRTGCQPEWLVLEITEGLLLENSPEVAAMLNDLHAMGVAISIDDFGTGYSALGYLNRFPVSQIKIDKSFVSNIPGSKDKSELVKAMLSIGTALHLEVVAEGVETDEQADYLRALGCPQAQGYLFGKPMERAAFEYLLMQESLAPTHRPELAH